MKSLLFGPAARLDFVEKFVVSGADAGILDLEDATAENAKDEVRAALANASRAQLGRGSMRLFVRTNAVSTQHFTLDVEAASAAGVDGIVVPMLEGPGDVVTARQAMHASGLTTATLMGGIESALGVLKAEAICEAGLDLVYFGAEDFVADMQGRRTKTNEGVAVPRSMVVLAARAARITAIDQVVVDIDDHERFAQEAKQAAALGYGGKLCIHPTQVPLANEAFQPSADEISWARGVVEAAADAASRGLGAISHNGAMIDAPVVARAQRILALAPQPAPSSAPPP